jgi:hypothetical protein
MSCKQLARKLTENGKLECLLFFSLTFLDEDETVSALYEALVLLKFLLVSSRRIV